MSANPDAQDYRERLGVGRGATQSEIKTAYRRLARRLHPDGNKTAAAIEQFHRVTEAYAALTDPDQSDRGSDSGKSQVPIETVMILLAEARVGSVDQSFPATTLVDRGEGATERVPGLVCIGQLGLAFVHRLSRDDLRRRPDAAVADFKFADIVSLDVEPVGSGDLGAKSSAGISEARIETRDGRPFVLSASDTQVANLRTVQIRFRAERVSMPSLEHVSFGTRIRGLRMGVRRKKRRSARKRSPSGSRIPMTNGWWVAVAVALAVGLILAAVLLG